MFHVVLEDVGVVGSYPDGSATEATDVGLFRDHATGGSSSLSEVFDAKIAWFMGIRL